MRHVFLRASVAILVAATLSAILPESLKSQEAPVDWRQFRGPSGQGQSTETELPDEWSPSKNILWKVDLPGAGSSSPIVVGQRVFFTCYTGFGVPGQSGSMNQLKYHLICKSTKDGSSLFDRAIEPHLPEVDNTREDHGYASSTPASDGEDKFVYTFFGKTGLSAFDRTYEERWHSDLGLGTHQWGSGASLVLTKELVIVNASVESGCIFGFDKKSGKRKWKITGIEKSWSTPLVVDVGDDRQELVVAVRGRVFGFDLANGADLWRCSTDIKYDKATSYYVPSLVAKDGIVYAIAGERSGGGLAVRVGGKGDVTKTHRLWTTLKGSNVSSPVLHEGYLYWMHEDLGIAYCAEAKSGKVLYEQRIKGVGQVYASPVVADGKLFFITRSGRCVVLAAKPKYELIAINPFCEPNRKNSEVFNASPALAGGRIFVRSDQFMYCVGKK